MNNINTQKWSGIMGRIVNTVTRLYTRSGRLSVVGSVSILAVLAFLLFYLFYKPVTVWDFSKTHTLADIGVHKPPSKVEWINSSYFGPTSEWWLGDFPVHNLDLVLRMPGSRSFRLMSANATFYGHGKVLGGMTARGGPYPLIGGGQHIRKWLRYWNFPRMDQTKFARFMDSVSRLAREGHNPEIDLYYSAPRGPSVAATMWTEPIVGEYGISLSVFWLNAPNVMEINKKLRLPDGRIK